MHRIWGVLSNRRPVLSQSNYSGVVVLRLGVAKLSAATVAEEDQRDSLPELFGARAGVRRSIRRRSRADSRLAFSSRSANRDGPGFGRGRIANSTDGNQIRRRLTSVLPARVFSLEVVPALMLTAYAHLAGSTVPDLPHGG